MPQLAHSLTEENLVAGAFVNGRKFGGRRCAGPTLPFCLSTKRAWASFKLRLFRDCRPRGNGDGYSSFVSTAGSSW